MKVWDGSQWLNAYASLSGALLATNNLSDLNNKATARTNLGVAIGTNVQAYDADLDAIAAITGTTGLLKKTAANTWSLDTNTYLTSAVTSVTGTSPVVSSGGSTPAISMPAATSSVNGYLTSADWTTFNGKQAAGSYVTSGGALGTPSSGTLTNVTGLPVGGISATGTPSASNYLRGDGTWSTVSASTATNLAGGALGSVPYQLLSGTTAFLSGNTTTTPQFITSTGVAGLATAPTLTGSTGSGNVVLSTSPTLVTPALGTPSSGTLTNCTFPTLNQNTTGTAAGLSATLAVASGGTGVTTSTGSGNNVLSTSPTLVTPVLGTPSSGTLTSCTGLPLTTGVTGTLPVANGGTGATTLTANNVLLGNGTSALQVVAPSTSGNVLTSNGTTWVSQAASGGGVTSLNGNTGALKGMDLISTANISGNVSTYNITGIPTGYAYLVLYLTIKVQNTTDAQFGFKLSINNGTSFAALSYCSAWDDGGGVINTNGNGYNSTEINGSISTSGGTSGQAFTSTVLNLFQGNATTGIFCQVQGQSSTMCSNTAGTLRQFMGGANTTSYVNAIQIFKTSGSYIANGTYSLYGVKNA
jgi:hypothetical protein